MILEVQKVYFSVLSHYNTTLASLKYKTSLFTAEFCQHSSVLERVNALACKPLKNFLWQSLFWQHKPGPPVMSATLTAFHSTPGTGLTPI